MGNWSDAHSERRAISRLGPSMRRLIIVGAGGLGREVETQARFDCANEKDWHIGGFLDTRPEILARFETKVGVIGDPFTYRPQPEDMFIAAIGDTGFKKKAIASLRLRGAHFTTLRSHVLFSPRARCGASVFGDRATVSVDAVVGDYAYIGADTILGHDSVVGDYTHVGARCFVAGNAQIGECATVHPMASIAIGVRIGNGATVGLGAVVFHNVPDGVTVAGNPARQVSRSRP